MGLLVRTVLGAVPLGDGLKSVWVIFNGVSLGHKILGSISLGDGMKSVGVMKKSFIGQSLGQNSLGSIALKIWIF